MPRVSVIVPTHNRPQMLAEAVESAFAQTRRLAANPKVKVVEMADSTLAASRNFGLGFAAGEWIAFLDDDDIWQPEKLEVQLAAAAYTGADVVTCDFGTFNRAGALPSTG